MTSITDRLTKRRTILGIPVGKRHVDWGSVRRIGVAGAGAVSTVAGGVRAWRGVVSRRHDQTDGQSAPSTAATPQRAGSAAAGEQQPSTRP